MVEVVLMKRLVLLLVVAIWISKLPSSADLVVSIVARQDCEYSCMLLRVVACHAILRRFLLPGLRWLCWVVSMMAA